MTDRTDPPETEIAQTGTVLRAKNGDLIRYEPSGLVMRLSDRVISDIARRLPSDRQIGEAAPLTAAAAVDLPDTIDAWDLRLEGDWVSFMARLPGRQGERRYLRPVEGGDTLAQTHGPLCAILGIGGARAALATQSRNAYPQHVVAPGDDIGAVGLSGVEAASATARLQQLPEQTHEALIAETLLDWRMQAYENLPLYFVRYESDTSSTASALAKGVALANLKQAVRNLGNAAEALGKSARILAVSLDFGLEDISDDPLAYRDGMLALMEQISSDLEALGHINPIYVARFESGTQLGCPPSALIGQWELAWNKAHHKLIYSAPGYMFELDRDARPTDDSRRQMAEMSAAAILASQKAQEWRCPVIHLAERVGDQVRLTVQSLGPIVLDDADPLGAGPARGFSLIGSSNKAQIVAVEVDPNDERGVLISFNKAPTGKALKIAYAYGTTKDADGDAQTSYPANRGCLRDDWSMTSKTGRVLHRWALPALLDVTDGAVADA
jgi:hypothetical protein